MNQSQLIGRLTKDIELRYTPNGTANARMTVAVQRRFKDTQTGEYKADFISVVMWGKTAEFAANNLIKGNRVSVVGRIETGNYVGQDGKTVYTTDVVAEQIQPIDWKDTGQVNNQSSQQNNYGPVNNGKPNYTRTDEDPFANNKWPIEVSEDSLPF